MFCLCITDMIGSIAMALSHLPMPSEDMNKYIDLYYFQGLRIGNAATCSAQGFFVNFGLISTCGYNAMLCVYYACTIAFNVRQANMKKYVEPILFVFPVTLGLLGSTYPFFFDMYNPTPWESWCSIDPIPYNCWSGCERGNLNLKTVSKILPLFLIFLDFVIITFSLGFVCVKVFRVQRQMTRLQSRFVWHRHIVRDPRRVTNGERSVGSTNTTNNNNQAEEEDAPTNSERLHQVGGRLVQQRSQITKVVLAQSFAYISAQVLTLLFPLLTVFGYSHPKLRLIFQPSQGVYNLIIFMIFRSYHIRQANPNMSIIRALVHMFQISPSSPNDRVAFQDPNNMSPPSISLVRSQDGLSGFRVGDDFISVEEYTRYYESTMEGLSVDENYDSEYNSNGNIKNGNTNGSTASSQDIDTSSNRDCETQQGIEEQLDDAFSMSNNY